MTVAAEAVLVARQAPHDRAGLALTLWTFAEARLAADADLPAALSYIDESITLYQSLEGDGRTGDPGSLSAAIDFRNSLRAKLRPDKERH
jgi:hypothetical protein